MLAGVACAAVMVPALPAGAQTVPISQVSVEAVNQAVEAFYESRHGAPLWLNNGPDGIAAREAIAVLKRSWLDGFANGPALASGAEAALARAQPGDPGAIAAADRLLSSAWVQYVQTLRTPPSGITYADAWVVPRQDPPAMILARAAAAPSLAAYVRSVSAVNPLYD